MSKSFETIRTFAKRETEKSNWSGEIGNATLKIESKSDIIVTLDGKELSLNSVMHLLNFSLQTLQDAYAGAASLSEAKGAFDKKRDAILNGTIGVRGTSDGESEETRVIRKIVFAKIKAQFKGSEKLAAFEALSSDERNAKLDANFAKNEATLRPEVEKEMERLREMRAAKAAMLNVGAEMDI